MAYYGYFLALLSSVFLSLYVIPRKFLKEGSAALSLLLGLGFLLGTSVQFLVMRQPLSSLVVPGIGLGFLCGVVWYLAVFSLLQAIRLIGLVRAGQWKNLQGLFGISFVLIFMDESRTTDPFWALVAGALVFASAVALTIPDKEQPRGNLYLGIFLAVMAGVGFGLVVLFNKYLLLHVGLYNQQVAWGIGTVATSVVLLGVTGNLKDVLHLKKSTWFYGLLSGVLYVGASYFMLQSYQHIDASRAYTVVQMNGIWTILIGLFIFHEIRFADHWQRISLGFLLALAGVFVLGLA